MVSSGFAKDDNSEGATAMQTVSSEDLNANSQMLHAPIFVLPWLFSTYAPFSSRVRLPFTHLQSVQRSPSTERIAPMSAAGSSITYLGNAPVQSRVIRWVGV